MRRITRKTCDCGKPATVPHADGGICERCAQLEKRMCDFHQLHLDGKPTQHASKWGYRDRDKLDYRYAHQWFMRNPSLCGRKRGKHGSDDHATYLERQQ